MDMAKTFPFGVGMMMSKLSFILPLVGYNALLSAPRAQQSSLTSFVTENKLKYPVGK